MGPAGSEPSLSPHPAPTQIVAGSTILDYVIREDPAVANAPIPEPVFDTSKNVDPATAAYLASLPAVSGRLRRCVLQARP